MFYSSHCFFLGWWTIYTISGNYKGHITLHPNRQHAHRPLMYQQLLGILLKGKPWNRRLSLKFVPVGLMEITLSFHALIRIVWRSTQRCVIWRPTIFCLRNHNTKKQKTYMTLRIRHWQKNVWLLKSSIRNWLRLPATQNLVMAVYAKKGGLLNPCGPKTVFTYSERLSFEHLQGMWINW